MLHSSDMATMIRRRSGLSQAELAERTGIARETLVRWEGGEHRPSFESLQALATTAGLEIGAALFTVDDSLPPLVKDQLRLAPLERLQSLLPRDEAEACVRTLRMLAELDQPLVVVGAVAGVLQGAPERPYGGEVDALMDQLATRAVVDAMLDAGGEAEQRGRGGGGHWWRFPWNGRLRLRNRLPGTRGYRDVVARAERFVITEGIPALRLGAPLDLLRVADASSDPYDRARRPGLVALLEVRARESARKRRVA